jgi:hypothetical protein
MGADRLDIGARNTSARQRATEIQLLTDPETKLSAALVAALLSTMEQR